jgi:CBS domain-containing protein
MQVADILKQKGGTIITIKPDATVADLSQLMRDKRVGAVVVSADGSVINGFVAERDLAYLISQHRDALCSMPVSDIMTTTVVTCAPDDSLVKVIGLMHARTVRHVPVVEGGRPIGMISIRDVLNFRVDQLQRETGMLYATLRQGQAEPQDR